MNTATKPLPPHGSYARYKGNRADREPCRCAACTRANRLYGVQRERNILEGRPNRIPRAELVPHIEKLLASGMSQILIGRQADVSQGTISFLLSGRSRTCRREQALRILAVQPGQFDNISERSALGARRRLQALYAIGHPRRVVSAASGLHKATISAIANGTWQTVDGGTDAAVRLAYQQLAWTPGQCGDAKIRAVKAGWHGPLAWDDIDDPACEPEKLGRYQNGTRAPRGTADPARVALLTKAGRTAEQIAHDLGVHERTVSRARSRARQMEAA